MATNRSSGLIGFARLFWIAVGPALLFLLAAFIAQEQDGWFTLPSIAFLLVMVGVVGARELDPDNSYGEPTTPRDRRAHAIGTIGIGLALWVSANVLGNHWFAS